VRFPRGLPEPIRSVLADAQTNGGLLAAVPRSVLARAERSLARVGVDAAVVGELTSGRPRIDLE
ncbi:MAG: selenide, water dikinase SelD, partial [Myxococcaceae bacterium]